MEEETKNYEIGFLLKAEENRKVVFDAIKNTGFNLLNEGQISNIKLAYPIKKQNFAQFGYAYFSAEPEKIEGFKKDLSMIPSVLRLTIFANPTIKIKEDKTDIEKRHFEDEKFEEPQEVQVINEKKQGMKPQKIEALTNEDLEKKLEEILK